MHFLDKYKDYMENVTNNDCIPGYKGRYHSFKYVYDKLIEKNNKTEEKISIIELGTSRSFVNGSYKGCLSPDTIYWEPNCPEKWDWGAGIFTRIMAEGFKDINYELHTVDTDIEHLHISQYMTNEFENIYYHNTTSENFLSIFPYKCDLIYIDTGSIDEETAQLQLRESRKIVEKDLIKDRGFILIDDVRHRMNESGGKAKYSIEFLQKNGYKIVMDEYQVILQKQ
jgi:hypothetical protein